MFTLDLCVWSPEWMLKAVCGRETSHRKINTLNKDHLEKEPLMLEASVVGKNYKYWVFTFCPVLLCKAIRFQSIHFCCRRLKKKKIQIAKTVWIKWEWACVEVMAAEKRFLYCECKSANTTAHWQHNWLFEQSLLLSTEAVAAGQGFPTKAK